MMKIVSFKICPFVQRVTVLLEVKGVAYQVEYISLANKPQWFLEMSPNGQVPVLITESGVALFESDAIAEYLDEVLPKLQPELTAEQRAIERAWSYQGSKNYLLQCGTMRSSNEVVFADQAKKFREVFNKVEVYLKDGPFFAGDTFGNVDAAWTTLLHRTHIVFQHTGFDFLDGFPKAQAWRAAVMASGIPERSTADDFEDAFVSFYLSTATYLGRGLQDDNASQPKPNGCC